MADPALRAEQARILYRQAPASQAGGVLVALVLVGFFWNLVPTTELLAWLGVFLGVTALRAALWYRLGPVESLDGQRALQWQWSLLVLLGITGVVWAYASWYFFLIDAPLTAGILIAIVACLIAGAIGALAPALVCYVVYITPLAITMLARLLTEPGISLLIPLGFAFFCAVCILYTRTMEQTIKESIELRFEKERLIAELEVAASEAAEDSAAKSRFLALASHDLIQPIHALELFMRALGKSVDSDQARDIVRKATLSTSILADTFASIMDVSKLEANQVEPAPVPVRLSEIVSPLVDEWEEVAGEKSITIRAEVADTVLETDPILLRRMIGNVIGNAVRYSDDGEIVISSNALRDHVELSIADRGIGINEEDLPNVFRDYYQAGARGSGGLGLGLAIVYRLSRLLDIKLDVSSRVNQGTTVTMSIPLLASAGSDS